MSDIEKTKVYISGPISGLPPDVVRRNFDRAAQSILLLGAEPIDPSILPDMGEHHKNLDRDLAILKGVDLLMLDDGWEDSSGCLREFWFASNNNIPCFYRPFLHEAITLLKFGYPPTQHHIAAEKSSELGSDGRSVRVGKGPLVRLVLEHYRSSPKRCAEARAAL